MKAWSISVISISETLNFHFRNSLIWLIQVVSCQSSFCIFFSQQRFHSVIMLLENRNEHSLSIINSQKYILYGFSINLFPRMDKVFLNFIDSGFEYIQIGIKRSGFFRIAFHFVLFGTPFMGFNKSFDTKFCSFAVNSYT